MGRTALPAPRAASSDPALTDARRILRGAAPAAAAILASSVSNDGASKEQISSANAILDRVGLRADTAPSAASSDVVSALAMGAFRALLSHFGMSVQLPTEEEEMRDVTPLTADDAVELTSLGSDQGYTVPAVATQSAKDRSPTESVDSSDAFFVALDNASAPAPAGALGNADLKSSVPRRGGDPVQRTDAAPDVRIDKHGKVKAKGKKKDERLRTERERAPARTVDQ
jgi:hypothetical protein